MGEWGLWSLLGEDINISNAITNHHVGASGKLAVETFLAQVIPHGTHWFLQHNGVSIPKRFQVLRNIKKPISPWDSWVKADKALSADRRTRQCVILRLGVASPADVRTCRDICIVDGSRVHFRGLGNRATRAKESRDDGLLAEKL